MADYDEFEAKWNKLVDKKLEFTVNHLGEEASLLSGYAVGTKSFKNIKDLFTYLSHNSRLLGGYHDGLIDAITVVDNVSEAIALGKKNNQRALYDFANSKNILLFYPKQKGFEMEDNALIALTLSHKILSICRESNIPPHYQMIAATLVRELLQFEIVEGMKIVKIVGGGPSEEPRVN